MTQRLFPCLILCLSTFGALQLRAQETVVSYFREDGSRTAEREEARYTRVVSLQSNAEGLHELNEYYRDDHLKRHGFVKRTDALVPMFEGIVEQYHENGQLAARETFSDGQQVDTATYYYANGRCRKRVAYVGAKPKQGNTDAHVPDTRLVYYADSLGRVQVQDGAGYATIEELDGVESGTYADGQRTGRWEGTFLRAKCRFEEWYEDGELIRGISTDSLGQQHPYAELEVHPKYPGDIIELIRFVAQNYRYPPEAVKEGVAGLVLLNFRVDPTGRPAAFIVLQDLGFGTGAEAIRVLKRSASWQPGYRRGLAVPVSYTLPIRLNVGPLPGDSGTDN